MIRPPNAMDVTWKRPTFITTRRPDRAMVLSQPLFGVIALPLLSRLYVCKVDIQTLKDRYDWEFRTKHELALELCREVIRTLRALGSLARCVVVFDGAYAANSLVRPLLTERATVVTRLRSDAKRFDAPAIKTGQRGRPHKYGKNRVSLKKRAGRRDGWTTISCACRGVRMQGRYKTIVASSHDFGGSIRVVFPRRSGTQPGCGLSGVMGGSSY